MKKKLNKKSRREKLKMETQENESEIQLLCIISFFKWIVFYFWCIESHFSFLFEFISGDSFPILRTPIKKKNEKPLNKKKKKRVLKNTFLESSTCQVLFMSRKNLPIRRVFAHDWCPKIRFFVHIEKNDKNNGYK